MNVVVDCSADGASRTLSPSARTRKSAAPGVRDAQRGFDREAYRRRNVVERCVGRLKQWRSVATRYEKRAVNYRAMVVIASLMVWLPS